MTEVTEKSHAKLGPSGAHRWMRCPGSVVLEAQVPNTSSSYARWGTAAHEVASLCLEPIAAGTATFDEANAEAFVGRIFTVEGFEIEVDMEMADCVNDFIRQVETYFDPGDILLVEQAVPLEHMTGEKDATGTADVIIIKPAAKEIVVIDLKGGAGVRVDAEDNEQCTMYGGGALFEHDLLHGPFEWLTNVIVQPRMDHVSEERISVEELEERLEDVRLAAGRVALAEDFKLDLPPQYFAPGEKQCKFCNAKSFCPALAGEVRGALVASAADAGDFPDLSLPKVAAAVADKEQLGGLEPDRLAEAKRAVPLIKLWIDAIETEMSARLHAGADPETLGFKLIEGELGDRKWGDEAKAEKLMARKLKVDERYNRKLLSVAQAEKLLKKEKLWSQLAALIAERQPGKPKVVPIDHAAPAMKLGADPEDFPIEDELFT